MKTLSHILDRAEWTRLVARDLPGWQWPDRSQEQWGEGIQELKQRHGEELSERNRNLIAKGGLDLHLKTLHESTSAVVRLARVRHRANPHQAGLFDFVRPDAKSRASIVAAAERLAELWRQLDAAWAPLEGLTLDAFVAQLDASAAARAGCLETEVALWKAGAALDEAAEALDADCIAWYATATAVFPESTVEGKLIRGSVPTTTVPQPPPGKAEITSVTAAAGSVRLEFDAPHGTRFTVLHRGPDDAGFKALVVDTKERFVLLSGLPPGEHRFKVMASNSRGDGPESEETAARVAVPQAA